VAGLASPSSTLEELYLFQKLFTGMGSPHLDHRLRQTDFHQAIYPSMGVSLEALEKQEAILLVGSNIRYEQPLGNHRIRKAALKGAAVMAINPIDFEFNLNLTHKLIVGVEGLLLALAGIAKNLGAKGAGFNQIKGNDDSQYEAIAHQLQSNEKVVILLGSHALNHPEFSKINALVQLLSQLSGAKIGYLSEGANAVGACLTKVLPTSSGMNAKEVFLNPRDAYLLLNVEPEFDSAYPARAIQALKKAFVVALSPFRSSQMEEYADVILPISPFTETSGTYINLEGRWQSFASATRPMQAVRPGWKVLRVLGNLIGLKGFDYNSSEQVRDEIHSLIMSKKNKEAGILKEHISLENLEVSFRWKDKMQEETPSTQIYRVADHPIYRIDGLVRRAPALQKVFPEGFAFIYMNPELAKEKGFSEGDKVLAIQGESQVILPVKLDARLIKNNLYIPLGLEETAGFGEAFGSIELKQIDERV
jgi:NADH-quinone oxidoreductase subunit G